ncbi:hypothetical protein MLD38_028617 [Melastoma candidum]|uniref:Uncharacterized protein n=1 Tax=Melastoma candidum TaxID=119954 RepID=A0ACB9N3X4_9MYRT|nr:hypothetical protein MLD38_028617 [Melastoma candidum]
MTPFHFLSFFFTISAFLVAAVLICRSSKSLKGRCTVPEARGGWPIIGHLPLFFGKDLLHKKLGAMADEYGPMFTMRLGSVRTLIVSDWEVARECFTVHDKVFLDKPLIAATKILAYDGAMFGFSPYGTYWRAMRKVAMSELLSNYRLEKLRPMREAEVERAVNGVYKAWIGNNCPEHGVAIDMRDWFADIALRISLKMMGGKLDSSENLDHERTEAEKCKRLIRSLFSLFGAFVLSDAIPALGWLDLGGHKRLMKQTRKEFDVMVTEWIDEHKQRRRSSRHKEEEDFMDVMLDIVERGEISDYDADTVVKATCLNMLLGGTDTITVSLIWTLSLLLNHPHALNKCREEIDLQVGKDRRVNESDIKNLVYLQAVVKESLRLYPPAAINSLRISMEECTLSNGCHVPARTRLMINLWKMQRDERVWSNPNEFRPERFLTTHKDINLRAGHDFELTPFGMGRRICPGISLALYELHLTMASLLQCFELGTPSGEPVDMTETAGLTNFKATPLDVVLVPRLEKKHSGL